ncbi:MAG: phosphotransferase [Alphaproteobacteria bacterium]|nr:phosphotransferase [Alphaproteobacteria bacterium]
MNQTARIQTLNPREFFDSRGDLRAAFLRRVGWDDVKLVPVGEDSAFRRYFRLTRGTESVILMESVPDGNAIATPGHNMIDFVRISAYLRSIGLCTPQVYDVDDANGYLLLQDFGDISFKAAMDKQAGRDDLYALATDVLAHLRRSADVDDIDLPSYEASHVHTGRRRAVDWYMPAVLKQRNEDGLAEEYLRVWDSIEAGLPPCPRGFLHIDYHFENLMWRPGVTGLERCGILDFQGAMSGPQPYDLANLLEDARVDVPADLRAAMLDRYCADMSAAENDAFRAWYRILATQFHCRVVGQFIRLLVRDGKDRYVAHIPRVAGYIRDGLQDPVLAPLKAWFDAQGVDFTRTAIEDADTVREFIRGDAF